MIAKQVLGRGLRGAAAYISQQRGARLLATNMAGGGLREWSKEWAALRSGRRSLGKVCGHLMVSHARDGRELLDTEWQLAIDEAREVHDLRDAAYIACFHPPDEDHACAHVHIVYCRVRPDGSVVSDSHSYRNNERAARRIERVLGLPPPVAQPADRKPGNRTKLDNARRRAKRKGLAPMNKDELVSRVEALIGACERADELETKAVAHGLIVRLHRRGDDVYGWSVAAAEQPDTTHSASTLRRQFGWQSVRQRLEMNHQLREEMRNTSEVRHSAMAPRSAASDAAWPAAVALTTSSCVPVAAEAAVFAAAPMPLAPDQTELRAALSLLPRHDLLQLGRLVEDLSPLGTPTEVERERLRVLFARLLRLVLALLTVGRYVLPPTAAEIGAHQRLYLRTEIDEELQRRAAKLPRPANSVASDAEMVAKRLEAAISLLAEAPKGRRLELLARNRAAEELDLQEAHQAHRAAVDELRQLEGLPAGERRPAEKLAAWLTGQAADEQRARASALRKVDTTRKALREKQREMEKCAAEDWVPRLANELDALRRDVAYWRRRAEILESELKAATQTLNAPARYEHSRQQQEQPDEDRKRAQPDVPGSDRPKW